MSDAGDELSLALSAASIGASSLYEYPYIDCGNQSGIDRRVFAAHEPFGRRSEALRTLRSQLSLRWFSKDRGALTVLSPGRDDTSSTLAANLAVSFAQLGERTLLIDANMRSPMQHALFGVSHHTGLSNLLAGSCSFTNAVVRVAPFKHLSLMTSGAAVPNPQELLAGETFAQLLALAPTKFKAIIIDTPPAQDCADAQIITARAGAGFIVARRHRTKVCDLRRIAEYISSAGAQVLGVSISD